MKRYLFIILLIVNFGCVQKKNTENLKRIDSTKNNTVLMQDSLDHAIDNLDTSKIRHLAEGGVNLNYRDKKGLYPLYKALKATYYRPKDSFLINTLINLGAKELNDSATILLKQCEKGNYDRVKSLINIGYNVNSKRFWYDPEEMDLGCDCYETPISSAVKSGNIELVKLLLNTKAEINFDEEGVHPLSVALQSKNYQIAELLLTYGADKNSFFILDSNYYDYNQNDTVFINYLIKNNYPYGKYFGPSAITNASEKGNLWLVKKLSSIVTKKEINKALCWAKNIEIAEFLLEIGADINYEFSYDLGESGVSLIPLNSAIQSKDLNYVKFLIIRGAEVNSLDAFMNNYNTYCPRYSPLLLAIMLNNYEIANYLLSIGANVNYIQKTSGDNYTSPLIEAVYNNNFELVKLLLSNNAKIENRGVSIYQYTKDRTDKRIMELLDSKR